MRWIKKGKEPEEFSKWKKENPSSSYKDLGHQSLEVKVKLNKALMRKEI